MIIKTVTVPEPCLKADNPPPDEKRVQFNRTDESDDTDAPYYVTRTSLENYIHNKDTKNEWMDDAWTRCKEKDEPDGRDDEDDEDGE